ncbi:MAG: hypothetical protein O2887_06330 [Bacteroidetes bacterium]|nr:hypothetical protein [Bacteroidota bacterium]MDA1120099.1 hypothetical protein [Bacteroidota bacterium]
MKSNHSLIALLALALVISGCATSGISLSSHITNVELGSGNFSLISRGVSGQASSEGIIGISYGFGIGAHQMSLIPVTSNRMLYKTAMENLWSEFEASNGSVEGRKLALANVRYDSESLNLFIYTKLTVVIIADIIEFEN